MDIPVTVQQMIDTLNTIGKERAQVVEELSYFCHIASLGADTEDLLRSHVARLNAAYSKVLEQVEQFHICP